MGNSKRGLLTRVITVSDPETGDEFEIYVTYEKFIDESTDDELLIDSTFVPEDVDIKHYESDTDDELPEWVTEDLVYDALVKDLEDDYEEEDEDDDVFYDDFDEENEEETDENW
jgi:hypothetical protein